MPLSLEQISAALTAARAEDRLGIMLPLLKNAPPDVFWPVFLEWFPQCENTWAQRKKILLSLRQAGSAYPYLSESDKQSLDEREHYILVVRGCPSKAKAREGLSWSLRYDEADAFARWHQARGRRSNVYTAIIPKTKIFALYSDDKGSIVLLDYECLENIQRNEDRPLFGDFAFGFQAEVAGECEYQDDNDDGETAELKQADNEPPKRGPTIFSLFAAAGTKFDANLPPIENMRPEALEAMLEQEQQMLKHARSPASIATSKKHIQRALGEIAKRNAGALAGRGPEKDQEHRAWGAASKKKSPGAPRKASKRPIRLRLVELDSVLEEPAVATPDETENDIEDEIEDEAA